MDSAQKQSPRILVIDNYDSFTFNLVHLLHECGHDATVWRNDKFALEDVADFDKIILSPGPGIPEEAGLMLDVIREYGTTKDRKSVVEGKSVSVRVARGGRRIIKKKK